MLKGLHPERIMQGLAQLKFQKRTQQRNFREVFDYSMPNVSDKVVRIIISYVDYIIRVVWKESRSEEHTSELQSLMRISYAVFCLKKTTNKYVFRLKTLQS